MIVDVEVLGAEDLGLDEQALAEIARADADRIELLHACAGSRGRPRD